MTEFIHPFACEHRTRTAGDLTDRRAAVGTPPADDDFAITYTPHPAGDHDETLFSHGRN